MIRSLDRDENYKITFEEFEKGFTPYKPANQVISFIYDFSLDNIIHFKNPNQNFSPFPKKN
jgi:hypothetical protein